MNNFIYSGVVESSNKTIYMISGVIGLLFLICVLISMRGKPSNVVGITLATIAGFYFFVGFLLVMITSAASNYDDSNKNNQTLVNVIQKSYDVKYMEANNNLVSRGQYTLQFKDGSLHMCTTDYLKNDKPHYQKVAVMCDNNKNFIKPVKNNF